MLIKLLNVFLDSALLCSVSFRFSYFLLMLFVSSVFPLIGPPLSSISRKFGLMLGGLVITSRYYTTTNEGSEFFLDSSPLTDSSFLGLCAPLYFSFLFVHVNPMNGILKKINTNHHFLTSFLEF